MVLNLPLREAKVRRQRGQQRRALAIGPGAACQPSPKVLGTVGDEASGEKTVQHAHVGLENEARNECLAALESATYARTTAQPNATG